MALRLAPTRMRPPTGHKGIWPHPASLAASTSRHTSILQPCKLPPATTALCTNEQGSGRAYSNTAPADYGELNALTRLLQQLNSTDTISAFNDLQQDMQSQDWNIKGYAVLSLGSVAHLDHYGKHIPADTIREIVQILKQLECMTDERLRAVTELSRMRIQQAAVSILAKQLPKIVASAGAIPPLVRLLDPVPTDTALHCSTMDVLQNLAVTRCTWQDAIADAGALPKLSALLGCSLPGVRAADFSSWQYHEEKSAARRKKKVPAQSYAPEAIPRLVSRLAASDRKSYSNRDTAKALTQLARDSKENQDAITEAGGLLKLTAVLEAGKYLNDAAATEALHALAQNNKGIRDRMVSEGVFDRVLKKYEDVSKLHCAVSQALRVYGMSRFQSCTEIFEH